MKYMKKNKPYVKPPVYKQKNRDGIRMEYTKYTYPKNHGISKLEGTGDPKEPCEKQSQPSFLEGPSWFL